MTVLMLGEGTYEHIAEGCGSAPILQRRFIRRVLILSRTPLILHSLYKRKVEHLLPPCWIRILS